MRFKLLILLAVGILAGGNAFTQTTAVTIGTKIPGHTITRLINFPRPSVGLTDFKGKILILDFWNRGCTSCIDSWPKLMKLQEKFKDNIQILLVNDLDDEATIRALIKRWSKTFEMQMTLPTAYQDKVVNAMFPHQSVPHLVWIDQVGTVKYISMAQFLNHETIENMILGKEMDIRQKNDVQVPVKWSRPLFINGNGGPEEDVLSRTVIRNNILNQMGVFLAGKVKDANASYAVISNTTVVDMFRMLYGKGVDRIGNQLRVPYSQVILKAADTTKLVNKVNDAVRPENFYTIQFTAEKVFSTEKLKDILKSDLQRYFELKVSREKVKKTCLVVSRSEFPVTAYKEGAQVLNTNDGMLKLNAVTLQELLNALIGRIGYYSGLSYPIVNESGFTDKLGNIEIDTNIQDWKKLSYALSKHGFIFSLQEREIEALVISDDK